MNKTVLIIGASQGIGKELVLQFAKESNTTVLALSRNIDLMNKNFKSKQIHSYQFDLATENRKSALTVILQNYSHIDIVVNNAGLLINKPFLELTSDEIINSYRVNVASVMECTQMVVPLMEKYGGHIVNISSMGGFQGSVKFPGLSAYASSKAAIASFTEIFAEEFKDSKIRVTITEHEAIYTSQYGTSSRITWPSHIGKREVPSEIKNKGSWKATYRYYTMAIEEKNNWINEINSINFEDEVSSDW